MMRYRTHAKLTRNIMIAALIPAVIELASVYMGNHKENAEVKQEMPVTRIEVQVTKVGLT